MNEEKNVNLDPNKEIEALRERVETLELALQRYGRHDLNCDRVIRKRGNIAACACGFRCIVL